MDHELFSCQAHVVDRNWCATGHCLECVWLVGVYWGRCWSPEPRIMEHQSKIYSMLLHQISSVSKLRVSVQKKERMIEMLTSV